MKQITQNQKILLDSMIKDEKSKNKTLYSAGPYWDYKVKKILYWIKKKGIDDFRGLNSGVGTSYTDNLVLDYRNELGFKGRLISKITNLPFIRKIYDGQINYTRSIFKNYIKQNDKNYTENEEVPDPYYGGEKGFERVIDLLEASLTALAVSLASH